MVLSQPSHRASKFFCESASHSTIGERGERESEERPGGRERGLVEK